MMLAVAVCAPAIAEKPGDKSADPRVKFKDGARYLGDLSEALQIPRDTICKELGRYDCDTDAFKIVLGGVEPYRDAIEEPFSTASLATPIALDRVALRVCTERVAEDVKNPEKALLYRAASPDKKWKKATIARIYDRLLERDATPDEVSRLLAFYDTVAADPSKTDAPREWTVLGCFSVASSLESVFY